MQRPFLPRRLFVLEDANPGPANLDANLRDADLEDAHLYPAHCDTNLEGVDDANLEGVVVGRPLQRPFLPRRLFALEDANPGPANPDANLRDADLEGAHHNPAHCDTNLEDVDDASLEGVVPALEDVRLHPVLQEANLEM